MVLLGPVRCVVVILGPVRCVCGDIGSSKVCSSSHLPSLQSEKWWLGC